MENAVAAVSNRGRWVVITDHRRRRKAFGIEETAKPILHPSSSDHVGAGAARRQLRVFRSNPINIVGIGAKDSQRRTGLKRGDARYRPAANDFSGQTLAGET